MPDIAPLEIPYERQSDLTSNRLCGPAALCMVYRSFGIRCEQADLVAKVAPGVVGAGARTYLLARDALTRGLSALVLRAKEPLRVLGLCHQRRWRAILNHRARPDTTSGHFTVLIDVTAEDVVVHDPLLGPNRRLPQRDLLALWQPLAGAAEITGNVLVVLAQDPPPVAPCPKCGGSIPDAVACPSCGKSVPLRPASVLGCLNDACPQRTWEAIFCPHCDINVMAAPPKGAAGAPPAQPGQVIDTAEVEAFSRQIDQFVAVLLAANHGAPVPGAEKHFAQLRDLQSQMVVAHQTEVAQANAKAAQPPPAKPAPAPPAEPVVAAPAPRPPLDGNALGLQLCTELFGGGATGKAGAPDGGAPPRQPTAKEIMEDMKRRGMMR